MSDKKTRSALKSLITTNFPSSTGAISAADLREWASAITESARLILEAGEADYIVTSMSLTTPPGSPSDGDTYVVGASATGAWSGQDDSIAIWDADESPAAWNFIAPTDRMRVHNVADDTAYDWDAGASPAAWTVAASGGSIAVEDEDSSVNASATVLNFTGAGVTASDAGGGQVDVTITGAGTPPTQTITTLSGTTTTVNIPSGCTNFTFRSSGISVTGTGNVLVQILSSSTVKNWAKGNSLHIGSTASTTSEHTSTSTASGNSLAGISVTTSGTVFISGSVGAPRDSGKRSTHEAWITLVHATTADDRRSSGYTDSAQDDDQIRFHHDSSGSLSGTVVINWYYS